MSDPTWKLEFTHPLRFVEELEPAGQVARMELNGKEVSVTHSAVVAAWDCGVRNITDFFERVSDVLPTEGLGRGGRITVAPTQRSAFEEVLDVEIRFVGDDAYRLEGVYPATDRP